VGDWPVLGRVADAGAIAWEQGCDEIIVALPAERYEDIERIVYELQAQPVHVHIVPNLFRLALVRARAEMLFGVPLVGLRRFSSARSVLARTDGVSACSSSARWCRMPSSYRRR
jgi:FlaA1/EpsC-like NDP-sugar epimerase